jgi:predicted kinase
VYKTVAIGSGNSSVADGVTAALELQALSSDRVRKEAAGLQAQTPHRVAYGTGIYAAAASRRTYEALAEFARQALDQGQSVMLDASFSLKAERRRMATLARDLGADFIILECQTSEEVIRQRLEARLRTPGVISEGRWDIFPHFQCHYEPVQEIEQACHIRLDTTQSIEVCVQQALVGIQERRP